MNMPQAKESKKKKEPEFVKELAPDEDQVPEEKQE
jgi:hypothetical protein